MSVLSILKYIGPYVDITRNIFIIIIFLFFFSQNPCALLKHSKGLIFTQLTNRDVDTSGGNDRGKPSVSDGGIEDVLSAIFLCDLINNQVYLHTVDEVGLTAFKAHQANGTIGPDPFFP